MKQPDLERENRMLRRKLHMAHFQHAAPKPKEPLPPSTPRCTLDEAPRKRGNYQRGRVRTDRAQRDYETALRKVGKHVGELVNGFGLPDRATLPELQDLLRLYSEALSPWAHRVANRMIGELNERSLDAWRAHSREISRGIRDLIASPVGISMRELLADQVELITSLPTQAGERVHKLTLEGLANSTRAREIAKAIAESGRVTESRAILIARTEVSRTSTVLTQARAENVGSTHYIWRTSEDASVRPGHKAMDGKVCEWANPPEVQEDDRVMHFHPGCVWNCRCWAEPLLIE